MARPTKFKEEYIEQAYKLCAKGLYIQDLAELWDVNRDTLHGWRKKYPGFDEAINQGRNDFFIPTLMKTLPNLLLGYRRTQTTTYYDAEKKLKGMKKVSQFFAPDTAVVIHTAKNVFNWKDTKEIDAKGDVTLRVVYDQKPNGNGEKK